VCVSVSAVILTEQEIINVYLMCIRVFDFIVNEQGKLNMSSVCVDLSTFALTEQYMINVYLMCICLRAFILIEQDTLNV
jgi:hypothetical protein